MAVRHHQAQGDSQYEAQAEGSCTASQIEHESAVAALAA